MNIIKVAHELRGDATSQPGEIKEGAGATTGMPVPQSELSPKQKDSCQFKLRDLDRRSREVKKLPNEW